MNLLPESVLPSVLCYAVCKGQEDEEDEVETKGVDVVFCNSNGYLIEVFNKKISRVCYLMIDDAVKVLVYYECSGADVNVYYLVRNGNGVLLVVRKQCDNLMVIKCFKDVKECKIYDFENRGYPQVGIQQLGTDNMNVVNFSKFDDFKLGLDNYWLISQGEHITERSLKDETTYISNILLETGEEIMEVDKENESCILSNYLLKKLQGMEIFRDELSYEVHKLNLMLTRNIEHNVTCSPVPATVDTTSVQSLAGNVARIQIKTVWQRIYNSFWILGIEFERSGIRDLAELDVVVRGEDFFSYAFRFFDGVCETRKVRREADDDEEEEIKSRAVVVVALNIPEFGPRRKLSASVALVRGTYQCHSETFHLTPERFLGENLELFRDRSELSLCEDLMACLAANRQVELILQVKYSAGRSIEDALRRDLAFTRIDVLGGTYYARLSGCFGGTSISVKRICDNLETWKLNVSVRDWSLLDILVKALRSALPMPVRVTMDAPF